MSDRFHYYLRVRYSECDAQKVVFNARYAEYVDLATTEFFRALGFEAELVSGELDYQLVKQTTEWKGPARFDQVLDICVALSHLGNTSFSCVGEFRLAGEEAVLCRVETVYVLVNARTLEKRTLPAELRRALQAGAPGVAIDHAGYLPRQ